MKKKPDSSHPTSDPDKFYILDHINDLVSEIDENGLFVYVNRQFKELLGYEPHELIGKPATEIIHPDDIARMLSDCEESIKSSERSNNVFRTRHKSGNYVTVESKGSVFKDKETNSLRGVAISRDITAQLRAEESRIFSEAKYKILHESMMDGFVYVNMEGKLIEFNTTYQQMLGYHPVELFQLTYQDITPSKWHAFEKKIVEEQVLVKNYSDVYQKEYVRKDGIVFPVELRTYLIRDEHRRPIGMWAIVRDITQRKRREEQMELLTKQLQDTLETKDKLFSVIAHDLRSPFNCMIGYAELIQEDVKDKDIEAIARNIDRFSSCVKQSYFLLENLLFWSNTQTGKISLIYKEIKLLPLLKQQIALFLTELKNKQIEVDLEESCNIVISADLQMVKSILRNLLSNAIKYSHISGVINFSVLNKKGFYEIIIKDRGMGMSLKQLKALFNKHDYHSTPGTCQEPGSGLGLKIICEFVGYLGGKIWAESRKNQGSSFHFSLPKRVKSDKKSESRFA